MIDSFNSKMIDIATEKCKAVENYRFIVGYPKSIFEKVPYNSDYDYFLPDFIKDPNKASKYGSNATNGIRKDELCYYAIKYAFDSLDYVSGILKSGCGFYDPCNHTIKPDRHSVFQDDGQERIEIGVYKDNMDSIERVLEEIRNNIPTIVKDTVIFIDCKKVKSNPRKAKVECTEKVYDQFNVLIEKGDLIAYPKGGDHNYYYVCKSKVVENTPKFVRLENGDMTKADKVIVIKSENKDKKLSF